MSLNTFLFNEALFNESETIIDYTKDQFEYAELYRLVLTKYNNIEINFTSYDEDISYGGITWTSVPIERQAIKYYTSLQVDELQVNIGVVGITVGNQSYTIPELIRYGFLENAFVEILRIDPTNIDAGYVVLYPGNIRKKIGFKDGIFSFSITHILDDLKKSFPNKYYQEQCNHRLFDKYCDISSATYVACGTLVNTASTITMLVSSVFGATEGYYEHGSITMTSGENQYIKKSIERCTGNNVYLYSPLPFVPASGDNFTVYPGCDKTGTMCHSKFNNYTNFFGFENIPRQENLYGF